MLGDVLDLAWPVVAIWNVFDFGAHVERMRTKHPEWSKRQLACCLYWQQGARKQHAAIIRPFLEEEYNISRWGYRWGDDTTETGVTVLVVPEAHGVNVTETMRSLGHELEWPPVTVAYQVALAGNQKGDK